MQSEKQHRAREEENVEADTRVVRLRGHLWHPFICPVNEHCHILTWDTCETNCHANPTLIKAWSFLWKVKLHAHLPISDSALRVHLWWHQGGGGKRPPSSPLKDHPDGSLEGVGPPGEPQDIRPPIYDLQLKKKKVHCASRTHTQTII